MLKGKIILGAAALLSVAAACSHKAAETTQATAPAPATQPVAGPTTGYIPRATVFKMSGPYADKVAVTLDAQGNLTYYPAPSDITKSSMPVYLKDGWWLNCQGLSANSVFTDWTFTDYAALPATPSPSEIKAHIIPGAVVTAMERTAVPMTEAMQNLDKIKASL